MSLTGHLAELRNRLLLTAVFIAAGSVLGWIFYNEIFALLSEPYLDAADRLGAEEGQEILLTLNSIAAPLVFQLKISFVSGIVLASPVWLYQIWAFVTPGMMRNERRWAMTFLGTAVPLFFAGMALAYWVLPIAIDVLLGFTPDGVTNLTDLSGYLSFIIRLLLVFGIAFELPVFIVMLNFAGVVSGSKLSTWRRGMIFGIFVFAAVGTPTGDPVTMLLLAIPMWLLFEAAVLICRIRDRRRGDQEPDYQQWADDEASPL